MRSRQRSSVVQAEFRVEDGSRPVLGLFSWVVLANLSRQVSFLVVNAVLFERLSRSAFGAIALAFGYMSVFAGLGDFGIRQVGWRRVARQPGQVSALAGSLMAAKTTTIALSMAAYIVLMPVLWKIGQFQVIYLAFALGIAFNGTTFDFPFLGLSRMDLLAKYSLLAFAVYLTGCLLLVTHDSRGWLVPFFFSVSMGLLLILQIRWLRRKYDSFPLRIGATEFRRLVATSWPLGGGETLNRLAASYPLLLIGFLVGSEAVGNYRIADLLYSFLAQFGHLFATAGFSKISQVFHHRFEDVAPALKRMLVTTVVGSLVAGLALAVLGPVAYEVLFEATADESLTVLKILGAALVVAAPTRLLKGLLASINRQGPLLLANAVSVSVGTVVGWAAISPYGIAGMAMAVLVAESVTLLFLLAIYRSSLRPFRASTPERDN